ncbi:MAG: hypothetical protein QM692_11180 [Thermomicrobiales bacterium]
MRTAPLRLVAAFVLLGLPLATVQTLAAASPAPVHLAPAAVTLAQTAEDQAAYDGLVAVALTAPPLAPAGSETLVESGNGISGWVPGVVVGDFIATADFIAPADASGVPWDIGFIVGDETTGGILVLVDSRGAWFVNARDGSPPASGPVASLSTNPGALNTLTLVMVGNQGILGVNGQAVGTFATPVAPGAGDVGVGVGFSPATRVAGRATPFQNFTVRPFDVRMLQSGQQAPAAPPTIQQEPVAPQSGQQAPVAPPTLRQEPIAPQSGQQAPLAPPATGQTQTQAPGAVQAQDTGQAAPVQQPVQLQTAATMNPEAAAFMLETLAIAETEIPDLGPATGQLVEQQDRTASAMGGALIPDAANFVAVTSFVNPEDTSTPWSAGIAFRYAPDGPDANGPQAEQILLAATGHIVVQHINGTPEIVGQALNMDTRPGARNTLEVLAYAEMALVGVNGVPVAAVSLAGSEANSLAGVTLTAGIYPADRVPGRVIWYEDFRVWFFAPEGSGAG